MKKASRPFWKKDSSNTKLSTKSSFERKPRIIPQRSISALAGRYVEPETPGPRHLPSLTPASETQHRERKRAPPEPPPKPEGYRSYSLSETLNPAYDAFHYANSFSGGRNSQFESSKTSLAESVPERQILAQTLDMLNPSQENLDGSSVRLSGQTMLEDNESIFEQRNGPIPRKVSNDGSKDAINGPTVNDDLRGSQNDTLENGFREAQTEAQMEERDFSQRLYQKFLQHFPQVNGFSADQQADRSKALWLISEANQESRCLCSRLDRQIAQAEAELRKQKKRHKVEMSTQDQWVNTLKQSESELKAKLAAAERDLDKRLSTVQGDMKSELVEKNRQLEDLNKRFDEAMHEKENNTQKYQAQIEKLKADLARRTDEISKAKKELEHIEKKLDQKAQDQRKTREAQAKTTEKLYKEMENMERKHAHEMRDIEARSSSNIEALVRQHDENTSHMREAHEKQLSKITANATQVMKEQEVAHEAALSEHDQKHKEQTLSLIETHSKELSDTSQKHQAELANSIEELKASRDKVARKASHNAKRLAQLESEHAQTTADSLRRHEAEKAKLEKDAANASDEAFQRLEKLQADHEDQMNELKKSIGSSKVDLVQRQKAREEKLTWIHQQQMQQVQEEVRDFNEALLTRDEDDYQSQLFSTSCLPRKTDEEICHQFEDVRSMVDTLSGLEWRKQQQSWTPEVFQRIGERAPEPLLRKAVVQDLIWTQLYHFVFSSPFRIFGSEGKRLEDEWSKDRSRGASESGSHFNWPEPSVTTELWRAFTIKGCRDVLRQQLSPHDQRASLKRGFKETRDSLVAALREELEGIVELTEAEMQLISSLCKQAAMIWLQFAMCQSRIVISLTGEDVKSTAEKVAQVQKGSLALTRLPRISRYGTVLGVELSKCTVVAGCDGDCRNIP